MSLHVQSSESTPVARQPIVWPPVSVVLPTYQERAHIKDCLDSLGAQDYPGDIEFLVVDGGSTDGTRDLVAQQPRVRLIENPSVTAAAAMNIGLRDMHGDVLVRADAHALYAPDFVRRNVEVLLETGVACVGGPMRPVGTTVFGRAVAEVTQSPFGVGPGRFHYVQERTRVDTVYLGCWRKETLLEAGGWDETNLQWAAEDQELAYRIRQAGGSIVLDGSIVSHYFPRKSPGALWRQYRNYGMAKASTLAKHRTLPSWRPLAPAALVGAAAFVFVAGRGPVRVGVPATHAAVLAAVALRLGTEKGVAPHRAFAVLEICHWSYGFGFWAGIGRIVRRRPFDRRPGATR